MTIWGRRAVLGGGLGALPLGAAAQTLPTAEADPHRRGSNTAYWEQVRALYDLPSEIVQLENGNFGAMARPVLAAYEAATLRVNREGSYYARRGYPADLERVRGRLARVLGAAPDEIAFTRGASEALQALISGYHRLAPGDQVLYADLDYPAMQAAMDWLRERRGVDVLRIALPEPATREGLIGTYARAVDAHPRLKLVLLTHVSHRTGLVLPVREIVARLRNAGVDCIVDSAHAFGQLDVTLSDLGADFVGLNLHKWFGAPLGVGALYVKRARLDAIEPFMADRTLPSDDVRARVHTGTANFAAFLAVEPALELHEAIGAPAKEARLRRLRDLWAEPLREHRGVQVLTPSDPGLTCALTSFRLTGRTSPEDNAAIAGELLRRFGVFTVHRTGVAAGACVRVTPGVFTREAEVLRLRDAVAALASEGGG